MSFEWMIAVRYFRADGMQSVLTVMGVAVGVSVFLFITSLIGGLQESLTNQVIGSISQVTLEPKDNDPRTLAELEGLDEKSEVALTRTAKFGQREAKIGEWKPIVAHLDQDSQLTAVSPVVNGSGFAIRGSQVKPISFRGVDPARANGIIDLKAKMKKGAYDVSGQNCVIGVDLARDLGVGLKDKIRVRSSKSRELTLNISGIFDSGISDVNLRSFFVSLNNAQHLLDLVGYINAIETKVTEVFKADEIADRLAAGTGLKGKSWSRQNKDFLAALQGQSSSKSMIQVFSMVSVAFGIASVLIVTVVQKSREIGILKSMGTRTRSILLIFLLQGLFVGLIGSILGSLMGGGLCQLLAQIPGKGSLGRLFPIHLLPEYLVQAVVLSVVMGIFAGVAPARRAAKLDPVEVIRYG